jgi:hypothetical protein
VSILEAQLLQKERERQDAVLQVKTAYEKRIKHELNARQLAEKSAQEAVSKLGFAEAVQATSADLERKYKVGIGIIGAVEFEFSGWYSLSGVSYLPACVL